MALYCNKLRGRVPVISRQYLKDENNSLLQYVNIESETQHYYVTPYLKSLKEILDNSDDMTGKRIFLITQEENIGIKVANGILNNHLYEEMNEFYGYRDADGEEIGRADIQRSIKSLSRMRIIGARDYLPLLRSSITREETFYFTGLDENDNTDLLFEFKLKCIMCCSSKSQFVQLNEEQVNTRWARELMMNKECEVIYLPKVNPDYYVEVLKDLLSGERYHLEDGLDAEKLIRTMMKKGARDFGEEFIAWSLDMAEKNARIRGDYHTLSARDFPFESYEEEPPLRRLEKMIGLNNMKNAALEIAAFVKEQLRNAALKDICWHMIFKGNPGTGKTICGRLIAQIKEECGQSNGVFIQASRKDIIGEHVGQTAPLVAGLFEKTRNGVLFVDEAGFLLHETRASYNQEAIKEFVRYMELYQDVTVIFALYPQEVEEWLKLDVGLSSRISRIVEFEDYTETELLKIAESMCEDKGYKIDPKAMEIIRTYSNNRRKVLGDKFGNAREMRKLVESAIIARSVRCYTSVMESDELILRAEDFEYGVKRLQQGKERKSTPIGFHMIAEKRRQDGEAEEQAC